MKGRAISGLMKLWGNATDTMRFWVGSMNMDLVSTKDLNRLRDKMRECLSPKGGEVTARNNTISLGNLYLNLSDVGRLRFLQVLATDFSNNKAEIDKRISRYTENSDDSLTEILEQDLRSSLESPRVKILKQFISLSSGLKFLVDMRADVISMKSKDGSLSPLEQDLRIVLSSWFDVGLLDLRRITWDSPASLLEKLIRYEAVHAISSWDDLQNRLDSDRRCFAFFHHKIPDEPLIFVEVALTNEIVGNVQLLLDENVPTENLTKVKTATFYSISSTQKGLTGINLGNFLIKRVVSRLSKEFKNIKNYVTLSPIPCFVKWLMSDEAALEVTNALKINLDKDDIARQIELLKSGEYSTSFRDMMMKLCSYYLQHVKSSGRAFDPVANFHLSNGASIKKLNWLGDSSEKGIGQSAGMMVNYHYEISKINDNHEDYIVDKKINCTKEIIQLCK